MSTKHGSIVTYLYAVLNHKGHVVLLDHVTNYNPDISATKVPMATKFGRAVTYLQESSIAIVT